METNSSPPHLQPPDLIRDGLMTDEESRQIHAMFLANPAGYDALTSVTNRYLSYISDIRLLRLDEAERASNPGFATSIRYWVVTHVDDFFNSLSEIKNQMDDRVKKTKKKEEKGLPDSDREFI